jgi:hypothetical protein
MRISMRSAFLLMFLVPTLSGCNLFKAAASTPPPLSDETLETAGQPAATSAPTVDPAAGKAAPGDIIFISGRDIRAIKADGAGEHLVAALSEGAVARDLTVSPDGRYLAYVLNGEQVVVHDLTTGQPTPIDAVTSGSLGQPVWSPAGDGLFYHKIVNDANGVPSFSQIWRAALPLSGPPGRVTETNLASDPAMSPVEVLGGTLIVHRFVPRQAGSDEWLFYDLIGAATRPLAAGYGIWDVSPDLTRMLLFNLDDAAPGLRSVPLYGALLTAEGAANIAPMTAPEEQVAYWAAQFAPDGLRVLALRYVPNAAGLPHSETIVLTPGLPDGAAPVITVLSPDPTLEDQALAWHGEDGVVVQRFRKGAGGLPDQTEIWLLPLDGSPGRLLAYGIQPIVVGGR